MVWSVLLGPLPLYQGRTKGFENMLLRSFADHQQVDEINKHLGIDDILTFFSAIVKQSPQYFAT
jgi:hypothetical protein